MDQPVAVLTRRLDSDSDKISIAYPVIVQMEDAVIQRKINFAIISVYNDLLIEQNFYNEDLVELIGYFEIKTNEREILSLNLIVYSYTGGAHGLTIVKSLTFTTKTGEQYKLRDLFKSGSNYVEVISDIIQQRIDDWDITLLDPPFKTIRPDQDYYLADTSIVIYFQLYEISPYAWGFPYFPISIKDLEKMIAPDGPLAKLITFT
ncbi:DUF3298 and DUF4163 domain-containing protein [Sporosarcina sp. Te-1]|uniref:DUF3298 and DUF4163 domain-containing protein n=1 Tax=Sporosarcina sp. Te-1 TaxID=2818390 RepID=UPI001A9FECC2|nr:DUF3298 and DUF4163 domain-containing protein [Sporosarcina sp. Te-1]QTD41349.1 DUF3298 and DUF4163 domain-containing protein [Sporosarcina sp. Te-1]